jgi:hypothetical protein
VDTEQIRAIVLTALASGRLEEAVGLEVQLHPRVPVEWRAAERDQISVFAQHYGLDFDDAVASLVALGGEVQADYLRKTRTFPREARRNQHIVEERQRERKNANRRAQRELNKYRGRR